jgi:hypothetical protein
MIITLLFPDSSNDDSVVGTPTAMSPPTAQPTVTPFPPPTNVPDPTPTPEPMATPTTIPVAISTPLPPASHVKEMAELIFNEGIKSENLFVSSVVTASWANDSLGCSEPGIFYDTTNAPYTGFIYVLNDGLNSWEYHTNQDDSLTIRCSENTTSGEQLTNIASEAGLQSSTELILMRRNPSTGQFEEKSKMNNNDREKLISIFDLDTTLSNPRNCNTIFRLDFVTADGIEEIEFMCEDNYKAAEIFWRNLMGSGPVVGKIVGPYLTGAPIPVIPTAKP